MVTKNGKIYKAKWNKEWQETHREEYRKYQRDYLRKLRIEAIEHYGGKCKCCGEDNRVFLTIDHTNGGGAKHRKEVKTTHLPTWLKKNNYPKGFQILCYNCNNAKHIYKQCPHQSLL